MKRGIFATCYANLKAPMQSEELKKVYQDYYQGDYFVRVYQDGLPESNHVELSLIHI